MRIRLVLVLLLAAQVAAQDPAAPAPRRKSFQAAVNATVERGVTWLRAQQQKDGNWKDAHSAEFPMGVTALCALALLRSDVPPEDPAIAKALEALKYLPIDKTYSTGLLLMVLEATKSPERHAEWAKRAVDFLVKTQLNSGLWAYPEKQPDLSNSQFAAFGLYAATRMGLAVPRDTFVRFSNHVIAMQAADGGFAYVAGDPMVSGSMTGAGVASLLLCRQLDEKQKLGLRVKEMEKACERGFGWLAKRFRADQNPSGPTDAYQPNTAFYFYYLYAVERAAVLGGRVKLGDHDWYREGAVKLVRKQDSSGHWLDVVNTSFALLFLKRASLTYSPHAKEFEADPKALLPIEDEVADDALAKMKITGTVPFLRDWVLLGPFPNFDDKLFNADLINEGKILPAPTLQTGKLEWKEWRSEKDFVDLDLGISQAGNVIGYAACYVWAESDCDGVLWFGSDEGAKVMLNRETVLSEHRHDQTGPDASRVRVKLKKGRNVLIVKVEELKFYWGFHLRFTDGEGRAIPLKMSVRPDKPEK